MFQKLSFFFPLIFLLPIPEAVASLPDLTKLLATLFSSWGISFPLGCDRTKQRAKFKNWKNKLEKYPIPYSYTEFSCGNSPGKGHQRWGEYCKAAALHPAAPWGHCCRTWGDSPGGLCSWLTCLSLQEVFQPRGLHHSVHRDKPHWCEHSLHTWGPRWELCVRWGEQRVLNMKYQARNLHFF